MENETISIGCVITPSNPTAAVGISILLDDQVLYENSHISETIQFRKSIPDVDGKHVLKFVLSGKTPLMTKIDEQGKILEDVYIKIDNVTFDDIDIDLMIHNLSVYEHDYNGSGPITQEKFFGTMGCNGAVSLTFTTPIYLWLLENM